MVSTTQLWRQTDHMALYDSSFLHSSSDSLRYIYSSLLNLGNDLPPVQPDDVEQETNVSNFFIFYFYFLLPFPQMVKLC